MNDPTLDAARARIRDGTSDILDDLDIPQDAPGIEDLTLDEQGILELRLDPNAFDAGTTIRLAEQIRGLGLSVEAVEHVRTIADAVDPDAAISPAGIDTLVAIGGAKGGVGRSTLTAALATTLTDSGLDVGIFDCDVGSGDIVRLLEIEDPIQSTPDGRPAPVITDDIQVVSVDLVAGDRPVVWRGAMVHDVLVDLLGGATWDDRDIVLLDLPPGVGDAVYTTIQDVALDGAVILSTPTENGEAGAERARSIFDANDVPIIAEVTTFMGRDGPYASEEAPTEITLPFDRALQTYGQWPGVLAAETTATLDALAEALTASLQSSSDDPLGNVIDMRGLPEELVQSQALLECMDAPDGPRPLLVDDTGDLARYLEDTLEAEPATAIEHRDGTAVLVPSSSVRA